MPKPLTGEIGLELLSCLSSFPVVFEGLVEVRRRLTQELRESVAASREQGSDPRRENYLTSKQLLWLVSRVCTDVAMWYTEVVAIQDTPQSSNLQSKEAYQPPEQWFK